MQSITKHCDYCGTRFEHPWPPLGVRITDNEGSPMSFDRPECFNSFLETGRLPALMEAYRREEMERTGGVNLRRMLTDSARNQEIEAAELIDDMAPARAREHRR